MRGIVGRRWSAVGVALCRCGGSRWGEISGAGKKTSAGRLVAALDVPHVELMGSPPVRGPATPHVCRHVQRRSRRGGRYVSLCSYRSRRNARAVPNEVWHGPSPASYCTRSSSSATIPVTAAVAGRPRGRRSLRRSRHRHRRRLCGGGEGDAEGAPGPETAASCCKLCTGSSDLTQRASRVPPRSAPPGAERRCPQRCHETCGSLAAIAPPGGRTPCRVAARRVHDDVLGEVDHLCARRQRSTVHRWLDMRSAYRRVGMTGAGLCTSEGASSRFGGAFSSAGPHDDMSASLLRLAGRPISPLEDRWRNLLSR
jgi:hypothetical protein